MLAVRDAICQYALLWRGCRLFHVPRLVAWAAIAMAAACVLTRPWLWLYAMTQ